MAPKTFSENDNVFSLDEHRAQLAPAPKDPDDGDWLGALPHGARFLFQDNSYSKTNYRFRLAGIAAYLPEATLLYYFNDMSTPEWVDTAKFSRQHKLIKVLPTQEPDKEAGHDDNHLPRPSDSGSND